MLFPVTHYVCVSSMSFYMRDCRFSEQIWRFVSTYLRLSLSVWVRLMKTNLVHYLSSVYLVSQILYVSGIFVSNHQEGYSIYTSLLRVVLFLWLPVGHSKIVNWKAQQRTKHSRHVQLIFSNVGAVIFRYVSFDFSLGHFQQRVAFFQQVWKII